MHEVSICQSIISMLEEELPREQHAFVSEIHVKVGVLSNVEPQILSHVFRVVALESPFYHASLHIESIEVVAACDACNSPFRVEKYRFICPQCGAPSSRILEGKELKVHRIVFSQIEQHEEINQ